MVRFRFPWSSIGCFYKLIDGGNDDDIPHVFGQQLQWCVVLWLDRVSLRRQEICFARSDDKHSSIQSIDIFLFALLVIALWSTLAIPLALGSRRLSLPLRRTLLCRAQCSHASSRRFLCLSQNRLWSCSWLYSGLVNVHGMHDITWCDKTSSNLIVPISDLHRRLGSESRQSSNYCDCVCSVLWVMALIMGTITRCAKRLLYCGNEETNDISSDLDDKWQLKLCAILTIVCWNDRISFNSLIHYRRCSLWLMCWMCALEQSYRKYSQVWFPVFFFSPHLLTSFKEQSLQQSLSLSPSVLDMCSWATLRLRATTFLHPSQQQTAQRTAQVRTVWCSYWAH